MIHAITDVIGNSPAFKAGAMPGDELALVNGQPVRDIIDYEALTCQRLVTLEVRRNGESLCLRVKKGEYEPMGLRFDEPMMSKQLDCVNKCLFCFVDQLPENVRPTLKVKDDDWRMSLMMGNFVTLTNVSDKELGRIILRRCHPLYISVHATDSQVRQKLMGQKLAGKIMEQLGKLCSAGLTFHTQAVICPGINDGEILEKTMGDLARMYPNALSLALVPVGLTCHRSALYPLKPFDRAGALRLLGQADDFNAKFKAAHGEKFVHPADELYILAGKDFPPDSEYGDYSQIENGVGLCRRFETEYEEIWRETEFDGTKKLRSAIACGTSVAGFLRGLLARFPIPGAPCEVCAVENHFFGPTVTVSGLLTGSDLVRAMKGVECDRVLISQSMLRENENVFLDDMTLGEAESALGKRVKPISDAGELIGALSERAVGG